MSPKLFPKAAVGRGLRLLVTLALAVGALSAADGVLRSDPAAAVAAAVGARAATVPASVPSSQPVDYLVLETTPSVLEFPLLAPGDVVYGQVRMSLQNADTGALSVTMRTGGALASHPKGLTFEAHLCDSEYAGIPVSPSSTAVPICALNERTVIVTAPGQTYDARAPVWDLAELDSSADRFLLITLRMPPVTTPPDVTVGGLAADFAFQIRVQGEGPSQGDPDAGTDPGPATETDPGIDPGVGPVASSGAIDLLARTGASVGMALAVAAGFVLLGTLIRTGRRRYQRGGPPRG